MKLAGGITPTGCMAFNGKKKNIAEAVSLVMRYSCCCSSDTDLFQ
jgi:hypothetical protein